MNKIENCGIHILEGNPDNKQIYGLCVDGDVGYCDGESCVCRIMKSSGYTDPYQAQHGQPGRDSTNDPLGISLTSAVLLAGRLLLGQPHAGSSGDKCALRDRKMGWLRPGDSALARCSILVHDVGKVT